MKACLGGRGRQPCPFRSPSSLCNEAVKGFQLSPGDLVTTWQAKTGLLVISHWGKFSFIEKDMDGEKWGLGVSPSRVHLGRLLH